MIVTRREYIGDVDCTNAFSTHMYRANPGSATTFPWLSRVAQNFEEYQWRALRFEYVSTSGVASATPSVGTVMQTWEPNAVSPANLTKAEFLNNKGTQSSAPYRSFALLCPTPPLTRDLFVLADGVQPDNTDLRLYDHGQLHIASEGAESDYQSGQLWVSYICELKSPQVPHSYLPADEVRYAIVDSAIGATRPFGASDANRKLIIQPSDALKAAQISFTNDGSTGQYITLQNVIPGAVFEIYYQVRGSVVGATTITMYNPFPGPVHDPTFEWVNAYNDNSGALAVNYLEVPATTINTYAKCLTIAFRALTETVTIGCYLTAPPTTDTYAYLAIRVLLPSGEPTLAA